MKFWVAFVKLVELFQAVEKQNIDRVQEILQDCSTLDINRWAAHAASITVIVVYLNSKVHSCYEFISINIMLP